jgi:hypothetical protein
MTVFYVHWHQQELEHRIQPLQQAGFTVIPHFAQTVKPVWGQLLPGVFVLSLDRLPSHSKAIADWVLQAKKRQQVPLVFEGGKADKVAVFRQVYPNALFVPTGGVLQVLHTLA